MSKLNLCAKHANTVDMLSPEQILEEAARDGSIDMYGPFWSAERQRLTRWTAPNGRGCWRAS